MPPQSLPPTPATTPPRFDVPSGATDCHAHIIDHPSDFPYVENRSYDPALAPLTDFQSMHSSLRLQRAVIVTPSIYGTDNRATLRAIQGYGPAARGVAVVDETITDAELNSLHEGRIRGLRINILFSGGVGLGILSALANRIRPLGWHLQLLIDISTDLQKIAERIRALNVPVVIDHMGHMPVSNGLENDGFQQLLDLLREGTCWVKLSGNYRISKNRPGFKDATPFAQALIDANPRQTVWGTDWPHVAQFEHMPNTGDLMNELYDYTRDPDLLKAILVDNPKRLYDFDDSVFPG